MTPALCCPGASRERAPGRGWVAPWGAGGTRPHGNGVNRKGASAAVPARCAAAHPECLCGRGKQLSGSKNPSNEISGRSLGGKPAADWFNPCSSVLDYRGSRGAWRNPTLGQHNQRGQVCLRERGAGDCHTGLGILHLPAVEIALLGPRICQWGKQQQADVILQKYC